MTLISRRAVLYGFGATAALSSASLHIAHYQQGGGDPVQAVRQDADRLLFLGPACASASVSDQSAFRIPQ